MSKESKNDCTKEEKNGKNDLIFSVIYNKTGESFQSIMEKILISKLKNN